ncbi:hypothetical protein MWN34_05470 [Ancylobacter sp. 6x-1]|uniref:Helix-turn-helix domain-containing protein n=1 Tax=Ancylobacter crimeensis TaxID=2579147 RepID=A0ABT0D8T2_9HYPH|nr:hypothetical protein [Ancylobacter crimeensis]MCK0196360.1 hypothetical protein [Ancylobacter crimeensis]
MSIPARAVSPDAVEEARRLYEHTKVPVQQIASLLGISKSTLQARVRDWGWTPRGKRIPAADAGALAPPAVLSPEASAEAARDAAVPEEAAALRSPPGAPLTLPGDPGAVPGRNEADHPREPNGRRPGTRRSASSVRDAGGPETLAAAAGSRRALVGRLVRRIEGEIAAVERLIARAGLNAGSVRVADAERAARTLGLLVRSLRELAAIERDEEPDDDERGEVRDRDAFRRELAEALERVLAEGAAR